MTTSLTDRNAASKATGTAEMRVLALGLPRSGTTSLKQVFESDVFDLDPCMHMVRTAYNVQKVKDLLKALNESDRDKRHQILHTLFDGFGATTDAPGAFFPDDLMDMYPDAAIVLNQRENGTVWETSFVGALGWTRTLTYRIICFPIYRSRLNYAMMRDGVARTQDLVGAPRLRLWNAEFYDRFNEFVREEARKRGRPVLEWKPADGWAPLCRFLGKPEPTDGRPFPRTNDMAGMVAWRNTLYKMGLMQWAIWGGYAGALWAAWRFGPAAIAIGSDVARRFRWL
jgi:hypothetical protein